MGHWQLFIRWQTLFTGPLPRASFLLFTKRNEYYVRGVLSMQLFILNSLLLPPPSPLIQNRNLSSVTSAWPAQFNGEGPEAELDAQCTTAAMRSSSVRQISLFLLMREIYWAWTTFQTCPNAGPLWRCKLELLMGGFESSGLGSCSVNAKALMMWNLTSNCGCVTVGEPCVTL